ncbi:immunoglobulin superfamily member 10-like isoform X1 [Lethenteron reissneri]|uniref:immunoglobulin superfamily member 10-like isoform X1 n=1 Tax=Lethenteron reissneri TaxID=7753 RepID=UPI002AB76274|nr:immunoglobulin superfamily member 10-like isoform X1 [Lethenteron reissneri]
MGCYTWFVIPLVWAAIAGPVAGVIVTTAFSSVSQMVGRDAFFSVSFSGNLVDPTVTWTFNNKIVEWPASNIGGNSTREEYKGRIAIYNNGSLLLQRVTLSDIGMYSVVMGDFFTDDGKGNITLGVYEVITNAMLQLLPPSPPKFGDSATLQCSAASVTSGAGLVFSFYKYGDLIATLKPAAANLGSANYTISNLAFSHRGSYSCRAENPVSNGTSAPVLLELECATTSGAANLTVPSTSIISTPGLDSTLSLSYAFFGKANVIWTFGEQTVASWILPGNGAEPQEFSEGNGYVGRTAAYANGSLRVKLAQVKDRGSYKFTAVPCTGQQSSAAVALIEDPWPATRSAIIGGVVGGVGGLLLLLLLLLLILMCRRKRKQKKSPPPKSNKNTKTQVETVRRMEPPPEHQRPWTTGDAMGGRNGTLNTSFHPNGNAHTDTMGRSNPAYNSYRPDLSRGARGGDDDDWRMDRSSVRPPSVDEMSLPAGADFSYANRYSNSTKSQDPLDNVGFPDSLSELTNVPSNPKFRAMTAV